MKSKKAALLIGIDSYHNYTQLSVCKNDAIEVRAALSMPEYNYETTLITDNQATRKNIINNLGAFFRASYDSYLFYFAGHGWSTDIGGYLVTVDADDDEIGIEFDHLKKLISLTPSNSSVYIVLDCCHSGAATIRSLANRGNSLREASISEVMPGLQNGKVLLAACQETEPAYENQALGHGIFTAHLLSGLMGEAADLEGQITIMRLYDYVSKKMSQSARQTPMFKGDFSGTLILGKGFVPNTSYSVPDDQLLTIECEAKNFLNDYQQIFATSMASSEYWRNEGYKMCCQRLEIIFDWFERKKADYPNLLFRPGFSDSWSEVLRKRSVLCYLEIKMQLTKGVVERCLGTGTFGTVWKVALSDQKGTMALKVYHQSDLSHEEKVKRFSRGYMAMRQLDHPHIVKVQEYTKCPMGFYMDYIDGPNLGNWVGTVEDPKEIVAILRTIAETLNHAHKRGVIHRDVKPENIIMSYDETNSQWHPYLTDFDLAWFDATTKMTQEALGTLFYSAPEQQLHPGSQAAHNPAVDSFSFGQLCYYTITGSHPLPHGNPENIDVLEMRIRDGWNQEAARDFVDLYAECIQRAPDKRPSLSKVSQRLLRIYQILKEISPNMQLSSEKFISEIIFSMIGLSPQNQISGDVFLTTLEKTKVGIRVKSESGKTIDLIYDFHCVQAPVIQGVNNFEQLRKTLLAKIDYVLGDFPGASKRNGQQSPFQVFVIQKSVPLTIEGVAICCSLIGQVADVLEGVKGGH